MEKSQPTQEVGSAFDLLGKSLEIVKQNWKVFAVAYILTIIGAVFGLIPVSNEPTEVTNTSFTEVGISSLTGLELGLVGLAGFIVLAIIVLIFAYFYVIQQILLTRSARGEKPTVSELMNETSKRLFRVILLSILVGLIILAGLILLIVPGIIAFGRLIMSPYIMIDKNLGVIDSIKESNRMSKKFTGKVWAAIGVFILIGLGSAILGAIPYIGQLVAAFITIAFSLVLPLRYFQLKKLEGHKSHSVDSTAPPPVV